MMLGSIRACNDILPLIPLIILFRSPEDATRVENEELSSVVRTVLVLSIRIALFLLYGYIMAFMYLF